MVASVCVDMSLRDPPIDHDVKSTDFGGWDMPVEFDSIRTEHESVREAAGKFDVSHMGEITVSGPDSEELMQRLTTNDVSALEDGSGQYAAITNEDGVILDDTIVYRLPDAETEEFLFIPNAGHDEEMERRWQTHASEWNLNVSLTNQTEEYAMFAVQGPDSTATLTEETDVDLESLSWLDVVSGTVAGVETLVSCGGYTGEAGFELLCPWDEAVTVWEAIDCQPCGLGARDTLRTEMGFLLSGQDFDPETNPRTPLEAAIDFAVDLDTEFVGRDALTTIAETGPEERFTGIVLDERGIPRHGYDVQSPDGEHLGTITSGTMSPTLGKPIALGYLPAEYDDEEKPVHVVIRDEPKKGHSMSPPFLP